MASEERDETIGGAGLAGDLDRGIEPDQPTELVGDHLLFEFERGEGQFPRGCDGRYPSSGGIDDMSPMLGESVGHGRGWEGQARS